MALPKYIALLRAVELGSISQAAASMGYTQPAVSRMIADLEKEWDVKLLHRSRAGLEISPACERLLPILRAIQADCDELSHAVGEFHGEQTGRVRIGSFTSVSDTWIPGLLKSFQNLYPKIEFDVINSPTYLGVEEWVRHGKVDCGFVSLPTTSDLNTRFLMRDELVAVLPPDHPMANVEKFPIRALENAPLIKCQEVADYEVSRFLSKIPYKPQLQYEVSSDHTILAMVESGLGISITHSLIADNPRYNIVWKRFDKGQHRNIGIATAKNARLTSATQLFIDHVCQQFSNKEA